VSILAPNACIVPTMEKLSNPGRGLLTRDTPWARLPRTMARAVADLLPGIWAVPCKVDFFHDEFHVIVLPGWGLIFSRRSDYRMGVELSTL
jgi:hypothetical protein